MTRLMKTIPVILLLLFTGTLVLANDEDGEKQEDNEEEKKDKRIEVIQPEKGSTTSAVGLGGGDKADKPRNKRFGLRPNRRDDCEQTERIEDALGWLRDHQSPEGFWSADGFAAHSRRQKAKRTGNLEFIKPGDTEGDLGWEGLTDVGLTGLALMAFAGAGYDHKRGEYRSTVRQGILYLRKSQDQEGCFGGRDEDLFVYNHAIATTALCEVFGLSEDKVVEVIAERGVEFVVRSQNPGSGWRYGVQPGNSDSSVTGWMVRALVSAKWAGLEVADKSFDSAFEWYDSVTAMIDGHMRTGYDRAGSKNARLKVAAAYDTNPALDAIHGCARLYADRADEKQDMLDDFTRLIADTPPAWEQTKVDFYYWFWASDYLKERDTERWNAWREKLYPILRDHQRGWHETDVENEHTDKQTLDEHGSWDPVGAWGSAGGRVYATALGALILATDIRAPGSDAASANDEDAGEAETEEDNENDK